MGVTVPENNARYCKTCQGFLPLDEFCPGPRRYYCRRHLKELNRQQHTPKTEAEKIERVLWVRCWKDSATYFGQRKLLVSHREVMDYVLWPIGGAQEQEEPALSRPLEAFGAIGANQSCAGFTSQEEVPDRGLEGVQKVPGGH